jgi:transposase-like protein
LLSLTAAADDTTKQYGGQAADVVVYADAAEIKRLKAELRCVIEEHDIYKKGHGVLLR